MGGWGDEGHSPYPEARVTAEAAENSQVPSGGWAVAEATPEQKRPRDPGGQHLGGHFSRWNAGPLRESQPLRQRTHTAVST